SARAHARGNDMKPFRGGKTSGHDLDRSDDDDATRPQNVNRLGRKFGIVALHHHHFAGLAGERHQFARSSVLDLRDPRAEPDLIAAEIYYDQQRIDRWIAQDFAAARRHLRLW